MKKLMLPAAALIAAAMLVACSTQQPSKDYAAMVNPMIGTGGHGHTFPGPTMPYGMIQPGPDTRISGWDACSGYHHSDSLINGFAQTHLSGTGIGDYSDFLIMPFVGEARINPQDNSSQNRPYASAFSHDKETATPGYYAVTLDDYDVKAEITSTKRAAIYRFTFPQSDNAGIIVDLDYSNQGHQNTAMEIEPAGDNAIKAFKVTRGWARNQQLSLYAETSRPFEYELITDTLEDGRARCKAILGFGKTAAGETVEMRLAISPVDREGAENNFHVELDNKDFETVRADNRQAWNDYLSKIDITTDDKDDQTIFYTALYHTAVSPNLFSDADGRYLAMDHSVKQTTHDKPIYTIYSIWDTHRALHPLKTIIEPELNNELLNSLITKYREGGLLPKWELAANYTSTMPGYHAVSLLADALTKGISDFDVAEAYKAAVRSSVYDTTGIAAPADMVRRLVPMSKKYTDSLGYIPCDLERQSVANGLEFAYDDYCIAQLAKAAGDSAGYKRYSERAQNYRHYFDPETRFMRGKDSKGKWNEPFNPRASNHNVTDYCEGTAWQWAWFVPQDVEGLIELMGGNEAFASKLDSLFTADSSVIGENASADISGLIGQYAHGNEPSHHIIHLYNYVDRPERTQELVDSVLKEQYRNDFDGLSGNEDCGQMSAWYVLNALGFYQVCPGKPVYSIGRPWFPHAEVNLPNGKKAVIDVKNFSKDNKYIKSMKLNGKELDKPFFTHDDILAGATLEFEMADK